MIFRNRGVHHLSESDRHKFYLYQKVITDDAFVKQTALEHSRLLMITVLVKSVNLSYIYCGA